MSAFVPEPIPRTLPLDLGVVRSLAEAQLRLGRLGGATGRLVNPWLLAAPFLRQEAILSSRIEGTITSPEQLALFEAGGAIADAAALLSVTPAAATGNVMKLVEAGILAEVTGRKRDRIFLARDVLAFMRGDTSASVGSGKESRPR